MQTLDTSVIICTWNRAKLLRRCLQALTAMELPPELSWEVVIVNNNSTDDTDDVVREFEGVLPTRVVHEPKPGLSHARNTAIANAKGRLLAWIDDDVAVDPGWLREHVRAAERFPQHGYFGGPVTPWFEATPPPWVASNEKLLERPFTQLDFGPERRPFVKDQAPVGANMVMRAELLDGFRFDPEFGRKQHDLMGSEEELFFGQCALGA